MQQQQQWVGQPAPQSVPGGPPRKSSSVKIFSLVLAAFFIFGIGFLLGDDRIKLNSADSIASVATGEDGDRNLSVDGVQELYDVLRENYDGDISDEALLEGLKKGIVMAVGDSYTEYLTVEEAEEFNAGLEGTFDGIGAELAEENGYVTVVAPIKGTPADQAGIRSKDIIVGIDGEPATELTVFEAVKKIRGEKGTEVVLSIVRDGEQFDVSIIRDTIDIASVEWRVEDGVGIIEISQFASDTVDLVQKAASEFMANDIKKVVLDMRGNPGGLLDQAIGVSNVWLEKGTTILEERSGEKVERSYIARNDPIFRGVETVVMIDEGSASASEIVAGALKANEAASTVGEQSFGKGSVQRLIGLEDGGTLKVTISRWYTPDGKNIDKEGITPDVVVERSIEDIEAGRDPQLDAAKKQLR